MDRFEYKEDKPVGKCAQCESDIYVGQLVYQHEDSLLCEETCKRKYADDLLGIVYGIVNREGEIT